MITRPYLDQTRLNWADTAPRPLRTAIWYPIDEAAEQETIFDAPPEQRFFVPVVVAPAARISQKAQTYPLIVMSHGTGGSALMLMWLGRHLASHGYIVAAVNHHGNTPAVSSTLHAHRKPAILLSRAALNSSPGNQFGIDPGCAASHPSQYPSSTICTPDDQSQSSAISSLGW